ncbi:hypothetical protein P170DRAFT_24179 [Aspergillus steynii IBT 23096]|uniref:Uncharacterized protein n=1 Tax=Aspergillus steynii IBT 23096 TaxID=1392250 RepID=A0A2I2GP97_9EURO|nr:uncharacterized protein P170DRAFT_24179 [Aspergillus steynii IBT 23096]PLB54702.1 hypothetical protein P170DRAFT_24179 [Aspergillus steynii IBT 23096]
MIGEVLWVVSIPDGFRDVPNREESVRSEGFFFFFFFVWFSFPSRFAASFPREDTSTKLFFPSSRKETNIHQLHRGDAQTELRFWLGSPGAVEPHTRFGPVGLSPRRNPEISMRLDCVDWFPAQRHVGPYHFIGPSWEPWDPPENSLFLSDCVELTSHTWENCFPPFLLVHCWER